MPSCNAEWGDFYKHLLTRPHRVESSNADDDHFNLADIVSSLGLAPVDSVELLT